MNWLFIIYYIKSLIIIKKSYANQLLIRNNTLYVLKQTILKQIFGIHIEFINYLFVRQEQHNIC